MCPHLKAAKRTPGGATTAGLWESRQRPSAAPRDATLEPSLSTTSWLWAVSSLRGDRLSSALGDPHRASSEQEMEAHRGRVCCPRTDAHPSLSEGLDMFVWYKRPSRATAGTCPL